MSVNDPELYQMAIDPRKIIEAKSFSYLDKEKYNKIKPIIKKIKDMFNVDEDLALDLLSENTNQIEILKDNDEFDYEKDYELQKLALDAAKLLGFEGVQLEDEQGTSYLIDMKDKLSNLMHKGKFT